MMMKRAIQQAVPAILALFALWTVLSNAAMAEEKASARQIMDKVTENRRLDGSEGRSTMTIYNEKGQKRVRKLAMVTKTYDGGKTEKKLSRFLAPADVKGTGFLAYDYEKKDDDMWMYLPSLRKTRRIVSSEKSKSFMGSEFSYNDMNIPNLDDYNFKHVKEEKTDGVDCWVIESLPKSEEIAEEDGYSKKTLWIGKTDYVLRKGVYYDLDGELLKELNAENVKLIDPEKKRYRAMKMQMVNKQNGRKSDMVTEAIELNRNVKDEYFTARYLERQ